ncbi:hypothetical protein [Streptomyces sp. GS7]|uniref:hypothetical protein n=1 Tax=Streptomyces sp. GS7 TaxID=2692234 RepID=UPI0019167DAB|nr:hypothetical protein [Streptomyces sp. GS7]
MFRHAFHSLSSAVADAPKAAVVFLSAVAEAAASAVAAAATVAAAVAGGARI